MQFAPIVSFCAYRKMAAGLPDEALKYFEELRNDNEQFSVLMIGEPGSGKTTLVSNLLGEKVAEEQDEDTSSTLSTFHEVVQRVCVAVFETSVFAKQDEQHQKILKELLVSGSISVTGTVSKCLRPDYVAASLTSSRCATELE